MRARTFSSVADSPKTRTSPLDGRERLARMRRSVVFPAPLRPSNARHAPLGASNVAPRSAGKSPKYFQTRSAAIALIRIALAVEQRETNRQHSQDGDQKPFHGEQRADRIAVSESHPEKLRHILGDLRASIVRAAVIAGVQRAGAGHVDLEIISV